MFPFLGNGNFKTKNGNSINIPRKYWMTMPTIAVIINYGAHPKWEENILYVSINDIILATSPQDKSIEMSLKEMYEDEYQISKIDILKMDCEMCEYALLYDDSLIKYLDPELIMLEFHAGAQNLIPVL